MKTNCVGLIKTVRKEPGTSRDTVLELLFTYKTDK